MAVSSVSVSSTDTVNTVTVTDTSNISVVTVGEQGLGGPSTVLGAGVAGHTVGSSDDNSVLIYEHANGIWTTTQQIDDAINIGAVTVRSGGVATLPEIRTATIKYSDGDAAITIADGGTVNISALNMTTVTLSGKLTADNNEIEGGNFDINGGDIASGVTINKSPTITLAGDLSGSATLTQLGNATLTATITADATALGTDTTGAYVETIVAGEGIDVSGSGGETANVTISAEDASDTNKGIASFDATDFSVSSGDVTLQVERIQDIVGAMTTSNTESGISVAYQDGDGTLDFDVADFDIALTGDVTGSGTVTNLGNVSFATTIAANSVALGTDTTGNYVADLTAGEGIDVSGGGSENATITVSAEDATASNKGIASFDSTDFTVSSGAVTINAERISDIVGAMVSSNTENGIAVTYEDSDNTLDFDVGDFDIALTGDVAGSGTVTNLGNVSISTTVQANSVALGTDTTGDYVGTITGGTGIDSDGATSGEGIAHTLSLDLNELTTETSIADDDFIAMVDATDSGSGKITFENLEDAIFSSVSGDVAIAEDGTATIQANSVALGTDTTGNYMAEVSAGEGIDISHTQGEGSTATISAELATETNAGVATFDGTDFTVTSGDVTINAERVQDIVGAMVGSNTESGISVTYEDGDGTLDFNVNDPTITIDGDMSGSATMTNLGNTTITSTLDTVNSNVGSFGSATVIPAITVNAKGLVTAVSTNSISTSFTLSADSGSNDTFNTGETLTISGTSNEIETAVSDNEITIGLPDNVTIGGNLTVTGDYTVNGTTTTVNTSNMVVSDNLIELNNGASTNANDSGIVIERGSTGDNAIFVWDESADKFTMGTTTATGASTGNLTITTGTLVANLEGNVTGNLTGNVTGNVTGNITGDVTGNADTATALETGRSIALTGDVTASGVSFDGTSDITLTTTIGANSVALGTDTTGNYVATIADAGNSRITVANSGSENAAVTLDIANNAVTLSTHTTGDYVESLVAGTGVTLSNNSGEGATPTVAIGQAVSSSDDVTFNTVTADVIGNINGATEFTAQAGEALSKGDAVYISGISGNTPVVSKADADDSSKMPSFGLAKADANNSASVTVVTFGTLSDLDTSSFSAGDILYISTTAGGLTATAPTGESSLLQNIGKVQRSHASAGSIKVGGAGRTNATPNLNNGKIFLGNGSNQAVSTTLDTSVVPENGNLYLTEERVEDYVGGMVTGNTETGITVTYDDSDGTLDFVVDTSSLTETLTNKTLTSPVINTGVSGTAILDEDDMSSDSSTKLATQQSIKAYVDSQVTAQDLDLTTDSGTIAIDLDSETLTISGGTGIDTSASTNTVTLSVDLNEMTTETSIAQDDFVAMVDATDSGSGKITFSNLEDTIYGNVSGDIAIAAGGAATIQANSVALGTDTTGNYVDNVTGGTGVSVSGSAGEGWEPQISIGQAVGTSDSVTFGSVAVDNFTLNGTELDLSSGDFTLDVAGDINLDADGGDIILKDGGTQFGKISNASTITQFNTVDSIIVPKGTTGQRPTGVAGMFRYNTTDGKFEGYTNAWGEIGGGGSGLFSTNKFTGDGSTTAFTMSTAPADENYVIAFIDGVYQNKDAFNVSSTTITFDTAPANTKTVIVHVVGSTVSGANANLDTFTGDGTSTDFTMALDPVTENNTQVYIDGVYQMKSAYSISGTTLSFSAAPANNASIDVMTFTQNTLNAPANDSVTSAKLSGALVTPSSLDVNGNELILDADADTSITADTDDQIDIKIAGTDQLQLTDGAILPVTTNDIDLGSSSKQFKDVYIDGTLEADAITIAGTSLAETISDTVGAMVGSNTETGIAVTYDDSDNTLDFVLSASQSTITSVGTLTSLTVSGDATFDTSTLKVDSTNNRVGIGTASPSAPLQVASATGNVGFNYGTSSSPERGNLWYDTDGTGWKLNIGKVQSGSFTSQMTIQDNGNVGIGTTSPTGVLTSYKSTNGDPVLGHFYNDNTGTAAEATIYVTNSSTLSDGLFLQTTGSSFTTTGGFVQDGVVIGSGTGASGGLSLMTRAASDMRFYTNGHTNERMRINSSGNVGIGYTSPANPLTVSGIITSGNVAGVSIGGTPSDNNFGELGPGYINLARDDTANAKQITFGKNGAVHSYLETTSSGLNIGGANVGIGTTSPANNLQIGTTTGGYGGNHFHIGDGTTAFAIYLDPSTDNTIFYTNKDFSFSKAGSGATGRVGIGTTSPDEALHVEGSMMLDAYNVGAEEGIFFREGFSDSNKYNLGIMTYAHNGSTNDGITIGSYNGFSVCTGSNSRQERMRISSTGRVGIGTSPSNLLHLNLAGGNDEAVANFTNAGNSTPYGMVIDFDSASPDDNTRYFYKAQDSSAARFVVYSDGDVWTSDAGTLTSDRSLKKDIADATSKLSDINNLKVRNFKWKVGYHPNKQNKHIGFIADEFETVFPSLVTEHNIARDGEDADMKKGIKYGALIPILVKALQEADDKIDALEARIKTLEDA